MIEVVTVIKTCFNLFQQGGLVVWNTGRFKDGWPLLVIINKNMGATNSWLGVGIG